MTSPSFTEMHRAVFGQESYNPDELVGCPFVSSHFMKRKKLPIHIPDCRLTYGRGFLACSYSQLHYFRTRDELTRHEVICPMRRQLEGTTRAAPSGQRELGGEESVSTMTKMLLKLRALHIAMEEEAAARAERRRKPDAKEKAVIRLGSEAQMKEREFLTALHDTVLYSEFRSPQILPSDSLLKTWTSDLESVKEEAEEPPQTKSNTENSAPPPAPYWYIALKQREKEDQIRNNRPKNLRNRMSNLGGAHNNRWEDDREASANPLEYTVDWNEYPHRYRAAMRAKFNRDLEILKTGLNPRYRKCFDHPSATGNTRSNPCQFEDQAAWYEDLVWKRSSHTESVPEEVNSPAKAVIREPSGIRRNLAPVESGVNLSSSGQLTPAATSVTQPWSPAVLINQVTQRMKAVQNKTITTPTNSLKDDVGIAY